MQKVLFIIRYSSFIKINGTRNIYNYSITQCRRSDCQFDIVFFIFQIYVWMKNNLSYASEKRIDQ